jgi:hypothetical protein
VGFASFSITTYFLDKRRKATGSASAQQFSMLTIIIINNTAGHFLEHPV